jgi:hypothetical protein
MNAPSKQERVEEQLVVRDERGRLTAGSLLNPAGSGRPALPAWFTDHAPEALLTLLAASTGRELECMTEAQKKLAREAPMSLRVAAADRYAQRCYAPGGMQLGGDGGLPPVREITIRFVGDEDASTVVMPRTRPMPDAE